MHFMQVSIIHVYILRVLIIESVDSISRDGTDTPYI